MSNFLLILVILLFLNCSLIFSQKQSFKNADSLNFYEPFFQEALNNYPELKGSAFKFKMTKIKTTLNIRPTVKSLLFHKKNRRTYTIRINNSIRDSIITLNKVPSNALTGLLGHELAHALDYSSKNIWGIFGRASSYLIPSFREKYEKATDSIAISRGMGQSLYNWSLFVIKNPHSTEQYKQYKKRFYLQPEEIKRIMDKTALKQSA